MVSKKSPGRNPQASRRKQGGSLIEGVALSHPEKPLWPHAMDGKPVTKLDLVCYLMEVGPWMLPHILKRPCSLVRAPDGIGGERFFQRHAMAGGPRAFGQIKVAGDRQPYLAIDNLEGLAAAAQIAALEFHPWNCQSGKPDMPGRLVFDLDPAPDTAFDDVITAAGEIKERLAAVGLHAFCKTTGGKGLHVVTPLKVDRRTDWADAKNFAHALCAAMAHDSPEKYLVNMSKKARQRQNIPRLSAQRPHGDGGGAALAPRPRRRHRLYASQLESGEEGAGTEDFHHPHRTCLAEAQQTLERLVR